MSLDNRRPLVFRRRRFVNGRRIIIIRYGTQRHTATTESRVSLVSADRRAYSVNSQRLPTSFRPVFSCVLQLNRGSYPFSVRPERNRRKKKKKTFPFFGRAGKRAASCVSDHFLKNVVGEAHPQQRHVWSGHRKQCVRHRSGMTALVPQSFFLRE